MRFIKKPRRSVPELITSSLPDLIFTVLFFFMIATHMREVPHLVNAVLPQGQELVKSGKQSGKIYIRIGIKNNGEQDSTSKDYVIQVNDKLVEMNRLAEAIEMERRQMTPSELAVMTVDMRVDRNTPMYIIADIRKVLRQSHALKVFYSGTEYVNK